MKRGRSFNRKVEKDQFDIDPKRSDFYPTYNVAPKHGYGFCYTVGCAPKMVIDYSRRSVSGKRK